MLQCRIATIVKNNCQQITEEFSTYGNIMLAVNTLNVSRLRMKMIYCYGYDNKWRLKHVTIVFYVLDLANG